MALTCDRTRPEARVATTGDLLDTPGEEDDTFRTLTGVRAVERTAAGVLKRPGATSTARTLSGSAGAMPWEPLGSCGGVTAGMLEREGGFPLVGVPARGFVMTTSAGDIVAGCS